MQPNRRFLAISAALASLSSVEAVDVTWTGAVDTAWDNGSNWDNGLGPAEGDRAYINAGSMVDFSIEPGIEGVINHRGVIQSGGVLNITGGELSANELSSATSNFDGTVNHSNGFADINAVLMGTENGANGNYFLSGGELKIGRAVGGHSLRLGGLSASGAGNLTISGGRFTTRSSVTLGNDVNAGPGTFAIIGSGASEIGLGAANTDIDATWHQHAGSTLDLTMDGGGSTRIFIQDNSNEDGTSATFEDGALLDLGFIGSAPGGVGGTWTVMEVENGSIIDNGLALAPGVDTSIWSFAVDNSGSNGLLKVTSAYVPNGLDIFWDGSESTAWEEPLNWSNNFGVFPSAYAHITSGTVDYTAASTRNVNIRGFRMTGGTLNISGGTLHAFARSADFSNLDGTTHHTDGLFDVNTLEVGSATGRTSFYNLSGGELKIGRASGDSSLYLGTNRGNGNAGNGTFTVSGGRFTSRRGVELGDATASGTGRFAVLGADASEILIGGANTDFDGTWVQNSGSTLEVGIDFAGVTPIYLVDGTATTGTSAIFASGSLLDVDYYNITEGGGSWVVMEAENGTIDAAGLQFAPGVDTSIWSFSVDNTGTNGRLIVTAIGDPIGLPIVVGTTEQQKMRYGMDYERLWFWNGSSSEKDQIARWTTVDADVDFVRVAMNSEYELTEGSYNLSAYTAGGGNDAIIPMMQEMKQANPNVKFFASPRPLNEAYPDKKWNGTDVTWQPYPIWVTGATTPTSGNYDFSWQKCSEYIVRYLLLMKSYGFKISFLDVTNEWQSNVGGGRLTQDDMDHIHEYLNVTYFNAPWTYSEVDPTLFLEPADIPEIVAPSSWNYSQGKSWINNLDAGDRAAISIAASHNTNRTGTAKEFADAAYDELGSDVEVWNTELHGWKSTSGQNETTSFGYYLEAVRAGFGGLNGWLAIGTTGQGHSYILNQNGTRTRNVKYHIFQKLSSTSNYGRALEILEEPIASVLADTSDDYDTERNVAAFIKGNLMTVWVINEHAASVPVVITPAGHAIAGSSVRRTHWIDPNDVEGFVTYEAVNSGATVGSTIPGESVCCFEIVLDTETFASQRIEAEDFSHSWGISTETSGDVDGDENVAHISNGDFTRYGSVALEPNSKVSFRVARPGGRPNSLIQVREGSAEGPVLGSVSVPETGNWQNYQTIETTLNNTSGIYNLYLEFVEDGTSTNNPFVNLNWFSVNDPDALPVEGLVATASGANQIDLSWDASAGASSYDVKRSESPGGPFATVSAGVAGTSVSDSGLDPVTTYYYVVSGNFDGEAGPDSELASATTGAEPIVPENLVISSFEMGYDEFSNEQLTFTIDQTGLGQSYQVHSSETMEADEWIPLGPVFQGNGSALNLEVLFNYSNSEAEKQFFRVEVSIE